MNSATCSAVLNNNKICSNPRANGATLCDKHCKPAPQSYIAKAQNTLHEFGLRLDRDDGVGYINFKNPVDVRCIAKNHLITGKSVATLCNKTAKSRIGCPVCRADGTITVLDRAKTKLAELGHTFVSSFKKDGGHTHIEYICKCRPNNESQTTDSNNILKDGWGGCGLCSQERSGAKHTLATVADEFKQKGFELLACEYMDNHTKMEFKCTCGEIGHISYKEFMCGYHCGKCRTDLYKKTCQVKYGCDNAFQNENIKNKIKQTNVEKRGVAYAMQADDVKAKRDATVQNALGITHAFHTDESKSKSGDSILKLYDSKCFVVSSGGIQLMQTKYGVDNAMQCPEIFERQQHSAYRYKEYILPKSQKIVNVQGYEVMAMDYLINVQKYDEDDIVVSRTNLPTIRYLYDNIVHIYYPDMYIKGEHAFIEVKSVYTLMLHFERNICKFMYANAGNLKMSILVFDAKNERPVARIDKLADFKQFDDDAPALFMTRNDIADLNNAKYADYIQKLASPPVLQNVDESTKNDSQIECCDDIDIKDNIDNINEDENEDESTMQPPQEREQKEPEQKYEHNAITAEKLGKIEDMYKLWLDDKKTDDDMKQFDAHQLKAFAVSLGIQFGVKKHIVKDSILKKLRNPDVYKKRTDMSKPVYAYERKMDVIRSQGHHVIKYEKRVIHYECKFCKKECMIQPSDVTDSWRMCKSCTVSRINREMNASRPQNTKQTRTQKTTPPKKPKKYELTIEHMSKCGHTDITYNSPVIQFTCKDCGQIRTTKTDYVSNEWHTCRNCSTRERNRQRNN